MTTQIHINNANRSASSDLTPPADFHLPEAIDGLTSSGATDALDTVDEKGQWLSRFMRYEDVPLYTRLEPHPTDATRLRLIVQTDNENPLPPEPEEVEWAIGEYQRRFFWDVDLAAVKAALDHNPYGAELAARFLPSRPVNCADAWSTLLKTVISNQIYPGLAVKLNKTIRELFGPRARFNGEWVYFYPDPDALASVDADMLKGMSFSRQKAEYLPSIGNSVAGNPQQYDWARLRTAPAGEVIEALQALHGVGKWTAHYVAMRGIANTDIFIDEKGVREAVGIGNEIGAKVNDRTFAKLTELYTPYRSFACYYTYMSMYNAD